jgi:CBS domain-containing protein
MVKRPIKVKASATIIEAVDVILENRVSGVCVVDDNDNLVGMLSELDCLRAIIERVYQNQQPSAGYVYEVMTKDVVVNKPGDDIVSVANSMLDDGHRRRPIMDSGKLVGQVTCRQLLSAIKSFS